MRRAVFILGLLLSLVSSSCGDSYKSSIPNISVYLRGSLLQSPYNSIITPGEFIEVTKNEHNVAIGYAGLILGQSYYGEYYSFDMACPVEASRSIAVHLKEGGIAVCSECGEEYDLNNYGVPTKGIGDEPLKKYSISVSNNYVTVQN